MQPSGIATLEKDASEEMRPESSRAFWRDRCSWIVFLVTLTACLFLIHEGQYWGGDFAQYLAQARALLQGNEAAWQQDSRFMIAHSPMGMGVEVAPWGYTFFLIPLILAFGENYLVFKIANALLFAAAALLFYRILIRLFPRKISLFTALIFGLTYQMLIYTNNVISDPLFLTLNMAAYLMLVKWNEEPDDQHFSAHAALFGLFGYLAYLVKSQGLILFMALFCFQFTVMMKDHWKNFRSRMRNGLMPYLVFVMLYLLITTHLPSSSGSSLYFLKAVSIHSLIDNARDYAGMFRYFMPLCYSSLTAVNKLLYALIVLLAAAGIHRDRLLCYFGYVFVLMMALLVVFPWPSGIRYLFSLYPILLIFAVSGLQRVSAKVPLRRLTLAAVAVLCCGFAAETAAMAVRNQAQGRTYEVGSQTSDAMDIYDYIRNHTPENAVVVFVKPRVIYLETGRLSYNVTAENADEIEAGTYFLDIIYEPTEEITNRASLLNGFQKELIYSNDRFNLYLITGRK